MLGSHYRPQLTSMLSLLHRATGVALTVAAGPVVVWWIVALGTGAEYYAFMASLLSSWFGVIVMVGLLFCLCYHLLNGIRHMVWDTGRALDMKSVYVGGWLVLFAAIALTLAVIALVLWR